MITHQQARQLLAASSAPGYEPLFQGLQALAWAIASYGFRFAGYPDVTDWNWYGVTYPGACQGPGSDVRTQDGQPIACVVRYDNAQQGINTGLASTFPPNQDGSPSALQIAFSTALATGSTDDVAKLFAARGWGFTNKDLPFSTMGAAAIPELAKAIYAAAQDIAAALGEPLKMQLPGASNQLPSIPPMGWPTTIPWPFQQTGPGTTPPPGDQPPPAAAPKRSMGKILLGGAVAGLALYGAYRASLTI